MKGKGMHMLTWILVVVGALNWLLFGIFGWEIGSLFGGMDATVSRIIYILVGLSGLVELFSHKGSCKNCVGGSTQM